MNKADVAKVEKLCRNYVAAMENDDLEAILAIYSDDATVTSPFFEEQPVRDFYEYVMRVTSDRTMELKTIFVGATDPSRVALHTAYTRTVTDGQPATVEPVEIFHLTPDGEQFAGVRIIYDSAPVRSDFDRPGARR